MFPDYTTPGYVEYVFRDHGLHPSVIAAVGGAVRVSVPRWEYRAARDLADRIKESRNTKITLRITPRPRKEPS